MADLQLETVVDNFLKQMNSNSSIDHAFAGFMSFTEEEETSKANREQEAIAQLFSKFSEANVAAACKLFAEHIYREENSLKAQSLLNYLEHLVTSNKISSKPLCEALLNSPNLNYSNRDTWCSVFQLVRRIVGGVDYKGCRDIFRAILYKCRTIPCQDSLTPQILSIIEVFNYILNRNACLLPSYFAINEIIKLPQHEDKQTLHWAFGKILAEFTQSFRPTVQIVTIPSLPQLRPVIGHSNINAYAWRLDLRNLRYPNNAPLPFDRDKSSTKLVRHIFTHAYSVDFMTGILIYNRKSQEDTKSRYSELEDQLCEHVIHLTQSQSKLASCSAVMPNIRWHNITSHIIFFVLWNMVHLPHMLMQLFKKLDSQTVPSGCSRDHLIWMILQCLFGVAKPVDAYSYITFIRIYDQLYPETTPLPVPDFSSAHSVISCAVTCMWAHLQKKTVQLAENKAKIRPMPSILRSQLTFLNGALLQYTQGQKTPGPVICDFQLATLCNAFSSNEKAMPALLNYLTDSMMNVNMQTKLPHGVACYLNTEPMSVEMLDCLSVHTKMLLIKQLFGKMEAQVQKQSQVALSPALIETFSRALVYTEIEQTFGIKTFVSNILPSIVSSKCLPVIHTLLEVAIYRLIHMQPHYRMKILSCLLDELVNFNHNHMYIRYENAAMCLLLSLGNLEVQQQVFRSIGEKKFSIVSQDSEELNKILVLTLARAVNTVCDSGQTGTWCVSLLRKVFEHTPHSWSPHTLQTFPPLIQEFYLQNHVPGEDKQQLTRNVDAEFKRWKSMTDVDSAVAHFSRSSERPLFLCVMWRCVMTHTPIKHTAYKVLEAIGPKALGLHLRKFCDYLASQLESCQTKQPFLQCTDSLKAMIWDYHIFTLDRFILCLSLRTFDAKDCQVCLFTIIKLLIDNNFLDRVKEFTSTAPAQYWKSSGYFESHVSYHTKYPEYIFYEGILQANNMSAVSASPQYLPTYFDNICLRMIPVIDVVIHRLIESLKLGQNSEKSLDTILKELSVLYKYHDKPVTYLYNTLHYYYKTLQDRKAVKKKLVLGILGHCEKLPIDLVISGEFKSHVPSEEEWTPPANYYFQRVKCLVDVMTDVEVEKLLGVDWRFTEFTSAPAHVLYSTCAEFLALPIAGEKVAAGLIDIIFSWRHHIPAASLAMWMNAIALIITALPEPYWKMVFQLIVKELQESDFLTIPHAADVNPFDALAFTKSSLSQREYRCSYVLALAHIVCHHFNIGQLSTIPKFIKEQVKPVVETERQFLFVCHLIGPFLQRFQQERSYCCVELTIELYEILEKVDKAGAELKYMDSICDFFYHIKYKFVGDEPKLEVEKVIKNLRTSLQVRLRFIAHHTTIEGTPVAPTPTN